MISKVHSEFRPPQMRRRLIVPNALHSSVSLAATESVLCLPMSASLRGCETEVSFLSGECEALKTTGPIEGGPDLSLPIFPLLGPLAQTVPLPLTTLQQIAFSLTGTHLTVHYLPWMQPY